MTQTDVKLNMLSSVTMARHMAYIATTWSSFKQALQTPKIVTTDTAKGVAPMTLDAYNALTDDFKSRTKQQYMYILGDINIPTDLTDDYTQDVYKKGTTIMSRRTKQTIASRSAVALDMDDLTVADFDALKAAVSQAKYEVTLYTTFNHNIKPHPQGGMAQKCRVVVPLTAPIGAQYYEWMCREVVRMLAINEFDVSCARPTQPMYMPLTLDANKAHYTAVNSNAGIILDTKAVMDAYVARTGDTTLTDTSKWHKTQKEIDEQIEIKNKAQDWSQLTDDEKREKMQKLSKSGNGILFDILANIPLEDVIEKVTYDNGNPIYVRKGNRYLYTDSTSGSAGADVYFDDAKGHSTFYSHHSSDDNAGRKLNAVDYVRYYLFDGLNDDIDNDDVRMMSRESMVSAIKWYTDNYPIIAKLQTDRMLSTMQKAPVTAQATTKRAQKEDMLTKINTQGDVNSNIIASHMDASRDELMDRLGVVRTTDVAYSDYKQMVVRANYTKSTVTINTSVSDLTDMLLTHPALKGRIIKNVLSSDLYFIAPLPTPQSHATDKEGTFVRLTENVVNTIIYFLSVQCKAHAGDEMAKVHIKKSDMYDAIHTVVSGIAGDNTIHPIADYLLSLNQEGGIQWDGQDRVSTLFSHWFGDVDNVFTRYTAKHFLHALALRQIAQYISEDIYINYQEMPILSGAQNIGKTTFFERLCGGYVTTNIKDMGDDKLVGEKMHGQWLLNADELVGLKRANIDALKTMITARELRYRPAYSRDVVTRKLSFCFAGTTNDNTILNDSTGARRFPVILCKKDENDASKNIVANFTANYVHQIWAQVMHTIDTAMAEMDEKMQGKPYHLNDLQLCYLPETHPDYAEYQRLRKEREREVTVMDIHDDIIDELISLTSTSVSTRLGGKYDEYVDAYFNNLYKDAKPAHLTVNLVYEAKYKRDYSTMSTDVTAGLQTAIRKLGIYDLVSRKRIYKGGNAVRNVYVLDSRYDALPINPVLPFEIQVKQYKDWYKAHKDAIDATRTPQVAPTQTANVNMYQTPTTNPWA